MQRTIESTKGKVKENLVCSNFSLKLSQEQITNRNSLFDQFLQQQQEKINQIVKHEIKITLPDGKIIDGKSLETTPFSIASKISKKLAEKSVVAKVTYINKYSNYFGKIIDCDESEAKKQEQSELVDLNTFLEGDCKLELLDFSAPEGKQTFWHSSAHVLGRSLEQNYGAFLTHGPPLQEGFFYDSFMGESKVKISDYESLEKKANDLVEKKVKFEKLILSKEDALKLFSDNPFKVQLIKAKIKDGERTSAYRSGDLIDLCTGPHIDNSSKIKAFKIETNSAAYWLGDQNLDELQRVYAISFPSKKELQQFLQDREELKKRDHRVVGEKQKLFLISTLAPGSTFFLPHGTRIFNRLVELMRGEYKYRGFSEVNTPTMFKNELWKISGHIFKYKKDMFFAKNEKEEFGIKPMNCPSHCLMFRSSLKSYRDLPIRFADFGVLHRNEVSGALTGLTRVRKFHQDDAHIFITPDQVLNEVLSQLGFLKYIYGLFGFEFSLELSTRPENFLGTKEMWEGAEKALGEALNAFGREWKLNPGDGAFYGPKIDVKVLDCFKRKHQLGTIQLDFNLPQRFNLQFKTKEFEESETKHKDQSKEDEEKEQHVEEKQEEKIILEEEEEIQLTEEEQLKLDEVKYAKIQPLKPGFDRPIIIHRAILGSLERCIAILIEHFGGKWPFWLSPRQICIIPVSNKFEEYGNYIQKKIEMKNYYVDSDNSNFTLNKRIRNAQLEQYNYILVVGESEVKNKTVNVRKRDESKPLGEMSLEDFYEVLKKENLADSEEKQNKKLSSIFYNSGEVENFKKSNISLQDMEKWNEELKYKNFFNEEGFAFGNKDKEIFEKLKELEFDGEFLPNLKRWKKMALHLIK